MNLNEILFELLILDGNDSNFIEDEKTYRDFKFLIIEVVKAKENIRYCNKLKCPCHPESSIRKILNNKELKKFLEQFSKGIISEIEKYINNYSPVISENIYKD